jgi:hypothetical protein
VVGTLRYAPIEISKYLFMSVLPSRRPCKSSGSQNISAAVAWKGNRPGFVSAVFQPLPLVVSIFGTMVNFKSR